MDTLSPEKRYCKVRKRKTKKCLDKMRNSFKIKNKENILLGAQKQKNPNHNTLRKTQKVVNNVNVNHVSKSRINIKHGFFAKGTRSETFSRIGLTEEFKARSEGDLYKIIDLANGKPEHISKEPCTVKSLNQNIFKNDLQTDFDLFPKNNNETKHFPSSSLQAIKAKSPSPSFKSPDFQLNLHNPLVGHISPIKFSPEFKRKSKSRNNLRAVAIFKPNPKLTKIRPPVGDYTLMYIEFADEIACELKKKIPLDILNNTQDLKQFLKSIHSKSLETAKDKKLSTCHTTIEDSSSSGKESILGNSHEVSHTSILLNPMQYLIKVNQEDANYRETNFRNGINKLKQSSPRNSKLKYIHKFDSHNRQFPPSGTIDNGGAPYEVRNNTLFSLTPTSSPMFESSVSSPAGQRTFCNIHSDIFTIFPADATPQPVFYPRRMNFNK